jgi:hypothetical protein
VINSWTVYVAIGLAIALGLRRVGAIERGYWGHRWVAFVMLLWPLTVPFLIWHGITVLQWKRARRRAGLPYPPPRSPDAPDPPVAPVLPPLGSRRWWGGRSEP